MLIATPAGLREINTGSATADGDAIDRDSGVVILSEGLAFEGWDELWVASGNQGRMNRRLGCDYRPISDGFRCSSDAAFSVAENKEGILAIDLLTCALIDLLHPSSNNSFQPPSRQPTNKGIVRLHLSEPAQVEPLWISSIGRKTEDNRKAIGIQCRISSN